MANLWHGDGEYFKSDESWMWGKYIYDKAEGNHEYISADGVKEKRKYQKGNKI